MSTAVTTVDMRLDGKASRLVMGPGASRELGAFLGASRTAIVIDQAVATAHAALLTEMRIPGRGDDTPHTLVLPGGEAVKTLARLDEVYAWLAEIGLTREGTVVGVGGGTILDLTGLAAATWKRGVDFVAVPTTLLAMVDAAIGGKTAINTAGLKNPVGVFHPASGIVAEPAFLATLSCDAWRDGLAELIKTALIGDPGLFEQLHSQRKKLQDALGDGPPQQPVPDLLGALPWGQWMARAAAVKADVVNRDFREKGPRRALNLGHTLGHVVEAWSQGQATPLSHGAAVSVGMAVVFRVAAERGSCPTELSDQVVELLLACGLPVSFACPPDAVLSRLLAGDKKASATGGVRWVLPQQAGQMDLDGRVTTAEIKRWLSPSPG